MTDGEPQLRSTNRGLEFVFREADMKRIRLDALVIFALFFGVAALEAIQTRNWIKAAFWLAIGAAFLIADNFKRIVQH